MHFPNLVYKSSGVVGVRRGGTPTPFKNLRGETPSPFEFLDTNVYFNILLYKHI